MGEEDENNQREERDSRDSQSSNSYEPSQANGEMNSPTLRAIAQETVD